MVAVTPEQRVVPDTHDHIEVPRRPAVGTRAALAPQPNPLAVSDARWDPDLRLPGIGPLAQRDLPGHPVHRLGEREGELCLVVRSPLRPVAARRAAERPGAAAEQVRQQVIQPVGARELERVGSARARRGERIAPGGEAADLVVLRALVGVADHVVGGGDLLEALLGAGIVGVPVRMQLASERAVGLGDVVLGCVRRHPEGAVIVLLQPLLADVVHNLTRLGTPAGGRSSPDADHRGPQHPPAPGVAGAEHLGHDRGAGALGGGVQRRFVIVRIERLARR